MRRWIHTLVLAAALSTQPGCIELMDGSEDSSAGYYTTDDSYVDEVDSELALDSDSYYYETDYCTDESDEDCWVEDELWLDDGWYYDECYDEWYYYDQYYDEWYYYDEYYDEWYYYDPYYDEWYYVDEYY